MISLTWTARASQQYHVESDDYAFSHSAVVHAVEFFFSGDLYRYLYNDFWTCLKELSSILSRKFTNEQFGNLLLQVGGLKYKQRDCQNYQSFCCISAPFPTGRALPLIIYRIIRSCNLLCLELKFLNEYYGFSHLEQSIDLFEDRSSAKERNVLALTSYIHGCWEE